MSLLKLSSGISRSKFTLSFIIPSHQNLNYHRIPSSTSIETQEDVRPSADKVHRELILSVLQAHPSVRDSRLYLKSFAPQRSSTKPNDPQPGSTTHQTPMNSELSHIKSEQKSTSSKPHSTPFPTEEAMPTTATVANCNEFTSVHAREADAAVTAAVSSPVSVADSILSTSPQHTGLVKIQGPFTDRQLASIVDGIIYLKTLGLIPIIVIDDESWQVKSFPTYPSPEWREGLRVQIAHESNRLAEMIEARGGATRPMPADLFRLGDGRGVGGDGPEVWVESLASLRSAVVYSEIPVISPVALNSSCASVCISADEAVKALAAGLVTGQTDTQPSRMDLTPLRLMIINREGGIPSPARNGHPHLSINLASEYDFIHQSFRWKTTHPTSLASLKLARTCLSYLPNEASALIVSHRSPKSLIANLITNKPAHSPSLGHATLLSSHRDVGPATPTLIRKGLPIRVLRDFREVDQSKMTRLLEASFRQTLDSLPFYDRLSQTMKFVIIAGDYQGTAIVTNEWVNGVRLTDEEDPIAYLDKFAVLPSLQGEGIVDFLWGALRDESFGLGCPTALNNNGGLGGKGIPMDLIWRSRVANPVNKWYWERSNGHHKLDPMINSSTLFTLFWCLADRGYLYTQAQIERGGMEIRLNELNSVKNSSDGLDSKFSPRLKDWSKVVSRIPSCWR
ncbi:hypothetical protein DFH28DRAFT_977912 [Melampsora americana]|nr:hypothetical protein DFH28DRAFT_977912 [Melampsora americana]